MDYRPSVIDLFSGCGGLSSGFQKAGFRILGGVDNWQVALNTFQHNHPDAKAICGDVIDLQPADMMRQLDVKQGEVDCIVGCPPCQGFSKNVPASYRFLDDPRNQLYLDFLAFVAFIMPKVVLIENVAELYNAYQGHVRHEIVQTLTELGYRVETKVLFAPDYGIPQRRRRCFFLASRTGITPEFPPPSHERIPKRDLFGSTHGYWSAWAAISDLPPLNDGEGYEPMAYACSPENDYQAQMRAHITEIYDHVTRKLRPMQAARYATLQPGQNIQHLPDNLRPKSGYSGAYGRLDFEMVAPTITRWVFHPGSGRFGHPREARLITIREAARLQSFSDDFRFTGTYIEKAHQVGNAVPPLLAQILASALKRCLDAPAARQS